MTQAWADEHLSRPTAKPALDRWSAVIMTATLALAVIMASWAVLQRPGPPSRPAAPPPLGHGYWHAQGRTIVDSWNRRVRIAAVTWFGAESTTWVPGGLDFQPYTKIMDLVKQLGYNTIRLTFSNELWERDPPVRRGVRANPQFLGKRAWSVIDAIVQYAGVIGLKIILDDQRSAAAPANPAKPGAVSKLNEPLWYTKRYPQSAWLRDWEAITQHYLGNTTVIGFDLRNEPHTNGLIANRRAKRRDPACRNARRYCNWDLYTYLRNGATWGPYNGRDNPSTDWRLAAERAGNAILRINNSMLIFVEGLQLYPDPSRRTIAGLQSCGSGGRLACVDSYWWGGILKQVRRYPIRLIEPSQLVYSPHEYGPRKTMYPWFTDMTYASVAKVLNQQWGFINLPPTRPYTAPIFVGETGTCTNHAFCYLARSRSDQGRWLHIILRYLKLHPDIGWCLWALNGTNALDHPTTDGLLNEHWNGVKIPYLQRLLASIQM